MGFSPFKESFDGSNRSEVRAGWGRLGEFRGIHHYDPNQPRVPKGHPDGGEWTRVAANGAREGQAEQRSRVDVPPSSPTVSNPVSTGDSSNAGSPAPSFWDTPYPYWDGISPETYATITPRQTAFGLAASVAMPLALLLGAEALGGAVATQSVWRLGWAARGVAAERAFGKNTPDGYPVIDRFFNGVVISIKSMDLNAAAYQTVSRITSRLDAYVDAVASFSGRAYAGYVIKASEIMARRLHLVIPATGVTAAQQAAIDAAAVRASNLGVTLVVTPFP